MKLKLLTLLAISSLLFVNCKNNNKQKNSEQNNTELNNTEMTDLQDSLATQGPLFSLDTLAEEPVFDIVTNMGTMRIKLYQDTPLHRENFAKLVSERFYDNILFHRVIKDFMIQTGDPLSKDKNQESRWGTGGTGYTIPAEFIPEHKHKKGAIAAARKGDAANPAKESSGSQFYIVHSEETCAQLDGNYTVFGETISGLDIIDKIASISTNMRDVPTTPVVIEKILLVNE